MKNKIRYSIACLFFVFSCFCQAQDVSENKATDIASKLFYGLYPEKIQVSPFSANTSGVSTETWQHDNINYMYVVKMPDNGWVLVAADERSIPILAIYENSEFPAKDDMPPAMLWLLED